jgi:hypothetical protein
MNNQTYYSWKYKAVDFPVFNNAPMINNNFYWSEWWLLETLTTKSTILQNLNTRTQTNVEKNTREWLPMQREKRPSLQRWKSKPWPTLAQVKDTRVSDESLVNQISTLMKPYQNPIVKSFGLLHRTSGSPFDLHWCFRNILQTLFDGL